ncbi:MAG: hypothetical protein ACE5D0_10020 [Fidelibacterota bacterium]
MTKKSNILPIDILFICTGNRDRSKTAEIVINKRFPKFVCKSAGTHSVMCQLNGSQLVNQRLVNASESIVFMQPYHYIMTAFHFMLPPDQQHHIWNIHKSHKFMEEDLINEILKNFRSTFHV